jgi:peroxiredoxin
MKKLIVFIIFIFLFFISTQLKNQGYALSQNLKINHPIIDFTLSDLKGKKYSLSEFKGKVILLNFWATWCPPCRTEIPILQKVYNKYKKFGFEVIAVSLDSDIERLKAFLNENPINFIILSDRNGTVGFKYGVEVIPTSFLIDKSQILRQIYLGIINEKTLISELNKWLKK